MGFLGFESKAEKEIRLLKLDIDNMVRKQKAEREGNIFFGTRYEDDYRRDEEKLKW